MCERVVSVGVRGAQPPTSPAPSRPSVAEPELPAHAVRHHRFQALGDLPHPLADSRPQFTGVTDGIRSRSTEQVARPLDLLLQLLVIRDVAEIEGLQKL